MESDERVRLIVRAARARSSGRDRDIYVLGPFAERVSFVSQQLRALNLAWALSQGHIEPASRVAVIGAGLAGCTAAAALMAFGHDVTVYERGRSILPRQRRTAHRMAHPTVNRWPAGELEPTTRLPFLDWHLGDCRDVVRQIESQWCKFFPSERLRVSTRVTEIRDHPAGGVVVETDPSDGRGPFDLAILAVGFGPERNGLEPLEVRSYWDHDDIETHRDLNPPGEFVVSGFGDGGLIDALRVAHLRFDRGRLAVDLAADLRGSTEITDMLDTAEACPGGPDRARDLTQAYLQAARLLASDRHADMLDRLKASLDASRNIVHLVDENFDSPFAARAAPIHKLMVAQAVHHGHIFYSRGKVRVADGAIEVPGRPPLPAGTPVIIRHGADSTLSPFLTDDEQINLQRAQAETSSYQAEPLWTGPYPTPDPLVSDDPEASAFWEDRVDLALGAVHYFDEHASVIERAPGFDVATRSTTRPGWLPERLFGVQVRHQPQPSAEMIA